ncbi:motility associated factor glycosyltransferase family protein [Campylobacter sp. MIT 21-1685]|uniref:motility associated factor glycosyltransferase family protein n=1 Tax=Campylobacter sp. MIT 21-1685 TaxID=2994323 RepID=UPI00224B7F78|nr:motility associated factor glycosyltransferase family protein [Campylobacter sp. MIT 21-1685]MCX2807034.1 motility associated factor glycosyltransferase family protein [Campylobacter sp. MIT 21-1685]
MKSLGGEDWFSLNCINTQNSSTIYQNSRTELEKKLQLYQSEYLLYPVLYFYGFGSGILYKILFENPNLKHIVVFEDETELLYSLFHYIDFSEELLSQKLILLNSEVPMSDLEYLCQMPLFCNFLRTYFLDLHSEYYEAYKEQVILVNQKMLQAIRFIITAQGNDIQDALQGISQFIHNIPKMLYAPTFSNLIYTRKKSVHTAIIVSTGPSLMKQLKLLKEYQHKASIFCADSAYSILAKYSIAPDYVLMSERTQITADLVKQHYENIDKNITFILLALVHPKVIEYLENTQRKYLLIPHPSSFVKAFEFLGEFGTLSAGSTVAFNALELAYHLEHTNIIFIGQDLAYAQDGSSHPKEYIYGQNYESNETREQVLAYGGEGFVQSQRTWILFKSTLERFIQDNKDKCNFYNATEGGARIKNTIEKPFLWCCQTLLNENLQKPLRSFAALKEQRKEKLLIKSAKKLSTLLNLCDRFISEFEKYLQILVQDAEKIGTFVHFIDNEKLIENIFGSIDEVREKISLYCSSALNEIIGVFITQFELNLARIYVLNPQNQNEIINKNIVLIREHIFLLEVLISNVKQAKENIQLSCKPLKKEFEKRNLKAVL